VTRPFPVAMLVLSVGAAVVYAHAGDWRRALYYWTAATVITISVTF
jgi:hypothetical protein